MARPSKPKKKPKKAGNLRMRFVDEYVIDQNATQAAIRAGYSPASAYNAGYRLLKDDEIKSEIDKRLNVISASCGITAERVLQEYECLAFLDPVDLFTPDGHLKPLAEIPEKARRAIAGLDIIQMKTTGTEDVQIESFLKKIKLTDKKGSLDSLAKILGMMKEKVEVTGQITLGALLGIVKEGE